MAMRWYVIHVYSGFEKKVAQSIEEQVQQAGLEDEVDQVLVPMEEVVELRRGAKVNAERKFFPGYVLMRMDLSDETWHLVKNTPKVTDFLGGKGRPTRSGISWKKYYSSVLTELPRLCRAPVKHQTTE